MPPQRLPPDHINTTTAARILDCHPRSVRRFCRDGAIPGAFQWSGSHGHWLIPRASVERLRRPAVSALRVLEPNRLP